MIINQFNYILFIFFYVWYFILYIWYICYLYYFHISVQFKIYVNMTHNNVWWRVDPVLAPDQFSIARLLRHKDLDRRVTRHGIYPLLPAPNGVTWSEYVRQGNRSRSVSSSTEALDSDHVIFVKRRIAQLARWMVTNTRLLPTSSPSLVINHLKEDLCQRVDLVI